MPDRATPHIVISSVPYNNECDIGKVLTFITGYAHPCDLLPDTHKEIFLGIEIVYMPGAVSKTINIRCHPPPPLAKVLCFFLIPGSTYDVLYHVIGMTRDV